MPTSFIKSTIDHRQSSFSGFFAASPSITALMSTTDTAVAAAGAGDPGVVATGAGVLPV
jgi:hypothetical protein